MSAIVEVFWVTLRVEGVRAPVSVLVAVVVNFSLPLLTRWVTGSRHAAMLPALAWFAVVLFFAPGTTEGDVVLAGNDWVALTLLLVGSVAAGVGGYVALSRTR
ncbi:MAG: hypothetical protein ACRDT8_15450 [Micromonosporaceae bacterium]